VSPSIKPEGKGDGRPEGTGRAGSGPDRSRIRYPTDWLLAVIDDSAEAHRAAAALVAAGFGVDQVKVLSGATAEGSLADLPTSQGAISQLIRLVQFMTMDQTPDLRLYEAALDDGRAIVAVHCGNRPRLLEARDLLAGHGAHFQNHFGRYATEEFSRWQGPELHPRW
jgi:hypothetical protein